MSRTTLCILIGLAALLALANPGGVFSAVDCATLGWSPLGACR